MKTTTKISKNIFDYSHVKMVTAVCLLKDGKMVGRIVANWSDNPAGSVCTASVLLYNQPEGKLSHAIGKAGGYGYDKLSEAIYSALKKMGLDNEIKVYPGSGNQQQAFEEAGYTYLEVC